MERRVNLSDIDLTGNKLIIIRDDEITMVDPPEDGYGEHAVTWINGKADRVDMKSTKKLNQKGK